MTKLKRYLRTVTVILIAALVGLTGYFVYSVYSYGSRWYHSSNNTRLQANTDYVIQGALTDRYGNAIAASSEPNSRYYTDDAALRVSMSQLLGDHFGMTSASLEQRFKRVLYGDEKSFLPKMIEAVEDGVIHGETVMLTIEPNVQKTAYNAMNGRRGAVAAINYKTGEILCSVSLPAFDPAYLSYDQATQAQNGTFVNKVLQGRYPPGSIFKTVTAASLIENGQTDVTFDCVGANVMAGTQITINCYHGTVHGALDLTSAFARSCNGAFAQWALEGLGAEKLTKTAENFGFNDSFLFADCTLYDSSFECPADDYALAWASVGQDKTLLTPLHAAMIAGAVANDGVMMQPRYLYATVSASGKASYAGASVYRRAMSGETAAAVKELMRNVVANGTGSAASVGGVSVCGKTGTAEVDNEESHAWFIGFIDSETAPYAVAVIVENAESGAGAAAPVAASVLRACMENLS